MTTLSLSSSAPVSSDLITEIHQPEAKKWAATNDEKEIIKDTNLSTQKQYVIQTISFNLQDLKNTDLYNSSNHFTTDTKPKDYLQVSQRCWAEHWVDKFHTDYFKIHITEEDVTLLNKLAVIYSYTGLISGLYAGELSQMVQKYNAMIPKVITALSPGWFVRANDVSLKYGIYKNIPHRSFSTILNSIITCPRGHTPLQNVSIDLYFLPWQEINSNLEFRVFVKDHVILACSQQNLFQQNTILNENNITQYIQQVEMYHNAVVREKITHIKDYCMDICILPSGEPYFIEINPFGACYSSGSALFHWIQDQDIFSGKEAGQKLYIRFIC